MNYDLIILGSGSAGLTASIYASRYKIKHLVIGKLLGGTATEAFKVENWPGTPGIAGTELLKKFQEHAQNLGAEIIVSEVVKIEKQNGGFKVTCRDGKNYLAKTLILALGTSRRKLDVPGEAEFLGKGVSYCATCDGPLYKDKIVGVVGGGNSAVTSAIMLSKYASQVYLFVREATMIAEPAWQEQAKKNPKIKILSETNIKEILGKDKVLSANIDKPVDNKTNLKLNGLFVEIGAVPAGALCRGLGVQLDEKGFIKIANNGVTNITGVFAAGDVTSGSGGFAQIITACAEGAVASYSVFKFLKGLNG